MLLKRNMIRTLVAAMQLCATCTCQTQTGVGIVTISGRR